MSKPWYKTNNPAMKEEYFVGSGSYSGSLAGTQTGVMTVNGTVAKTGLLLSIVFAMGIVGYLFPNPVLAMAAIVLAIVAAIVGMFKREWAMPISLAYSVLEGYALGFISLLYSIQFADTQYKGIVPMAMAATFAVFGTMLTLYVTRVIKVTDTFRTIVWGATAGAMLFYLGTFLISFVMPGIYEALPVFSAGPIGIGFSLLMIVLAAANFATDFDMIERGVEARAPKYMEWFGAFAVMLTIVWLYLEMLRLISKIARSR
ncbi:MAG: Bax inhibitor-1/YccA family protein [Armatimonadetes bacterium]|nr:Bax inhibitor-1/YccA family protein [Armatimonadota bacterium]